MIQQPKNEEESVHAGDPAGHAQDTETGATAGDSQEQEQEAAGADSSTSEAEGSEPSENGEDPAVWRDKYLRLYAEFDNFRKRTMRERGELVRSAGREVTESLLPVLDDFERAMAASEGQDLEQMREGYLLIGQKMRGILEARGLERMEAKGAEFDTDLHEAITQIPAPEPQMKGKVVDVVEPGYKLHDTVLRFAKVVVGN
ncbi:MAG TPA: nucleotide exchange factor GrpE [Flavobacteriales bacterium]|jgi:molecular chaperone GrpE|nr:nucleotide exchange factor GrpE [Flavobacteriales bacterium]